jgi:large repetitive protein
VSSSATVTTISDMSVTATGNAPAHVGDAISYTLVATNLGPNVAPAAQLTFQLAAGLTPGTVSSAEAACSSGSSGQVTCNLNDLAVAKAVTVTVNATAATVGAQTSTASVSSSATDLVSANNVATTTTTVSAVPAPASGHGGGGELSLYEAFALISLLVAGRLRSWRLSRRGDAAHMSADIARRSGCVQ